MIHTVLAGVSWPRLDNESLFRRGNICPSSAHTMLFFKWEILIIIYNLFISIIIIIFRKPILFIIASYSGGFQFVVNIDKCFRSKELVKQLHSSKTERQLIEGTLLQRKHLCHTEETCCIVKEINVEKKSFPPCWVTFFCLDHDFLHPAWQQTLWTIMQADQMHIPTLKNVYTKQISKKPCLGLLFPQFNSFHQLWCFFRIRT